MMGLSMVGLVVGIQPGTRNLWWVRVRVFFFFIGFVVG